MPNGHRDPYRMSHGSSPSPVHTSDSEETYTNKKRWWWVASKVFWRLRNNVRRKKQARGMGALASLKLLPKDLPVIVFTLLADFLW